MKITKEQALAALEDLYDIGMRSDDVGDLYADLKQYINENSPFIVPDLHDKKIVPEHTKECLEWQKEHPSHEGWCIGGCTYRLVDLLDE